MDPTKRLRSVLLGPNIVAVAWIIVSSVLWASSVAKATSFAVFVFYITSVFPVSTPVAIAGAVVLITIEALVPLIALLNNGLRTAALVARALFAGFVIFHGVRLLIGDPLPCSCFGSLVTLSTGVYLVIDSLCFACANAVYQDIVQRVQGRNHTPSRRILQVASCFFAASIALGVVRGQQRLATGQSLQLSYDASRFISDERLLHKGPLAKASLVIFGDYSCPFSRTLLSSDEFRNVLARDDISVYWRELPLARLHPRARTLAVLSQISRARNGSSDCQLIVSKQLDVMKLADLLKTGLTPAPTRSEIEAALVCVSEDESLASSHGLNRTPLLIAVTQRRSFLISDLGALDTIL